MVFCWNESWRFILHQKSKKRAAEDYKYLPDETVYQLEHGNASTTSTFGYDARGFPESLQRRRSDSTLLSSRTYTRDQRDRIMSFQKAYNPGVNPLENGRGDRFGYDEAGQLIEGWYNATNPANSGAGNTRYDGFSYDALGNRGQHNYVASRGQMDFTKKDNGLNQYPGWFPYSYTNYDDDLNGWGAPGAANGVLMQDGWVTAGFNALNQPMHISSPAYYGTGNWMFFGFDPLGRCVKRWIGPMDENGNRPPPWSNPATYFHYEGWNLLQEGANAWGPARVYVHGSRVDEIAWSYNTFTGEQAFHHYDVRGHCTLLTDSAGNILEQYEYDAFGWPYFYDASGNAIGAYDPVQHLWEGYSLFGNRFLFTGREWIPDLKLYDYRNRLYQPELGRFLQPDPKHFAAGDYNLYRYCHNDPVNKSDPTGLLTVDFSWSHAMYMQGNALASFNDILDAVLRFFSTSSSPSSPSKQTTSENSAGQRYVGARAKVEHDENFDVTKEERLYITGTNIEAKAKTYRTLLKPKAEVGGDGRIHFTQVVYSKTTFKVGSPQADIDAEWRRVESVRAEVKTLNTVAQQAALRHFSSAEEAERIIGNATQNEWNSFLLRDTTRFEIIGGGR